MVLSSRNSFLLKRKLRNLLEKPGLFRGRHDIVMLGGRVTTGGDGLYILLECGLERGCVVRQAGDETRTVGGQSQGIVGHDDTAVTEWPSTAADHRNGSLVYHSLCNLGRHSLKQYPSRSRALHEQRR